MYNKLKLQNEKTMVWFSRTELSLSLSCTEFRALSHGHGFRGPCFNGVCKSLFFHDFWTVFLIMFLTRVLNRFPTVSQLFSCVILDCQNKKYYEILAPWNFLAAATKKIRKTSGSPVLMFSYCRMGRVYGVPPQLWATKLSLADLKDGGYPFGPQPFGPQPLVKLVTIHGPQHL